MLKRGRKSQKWDRIRAKLKCEFSAMGIERCERCNAPYPLGFAHRMKRRSITNDEEMRRVALLCNPCHERIEYGGNMFEEVSAIIQDRLSRV